MNLVRQIVPQGLFWRSFLIMLMPLVLLQGVVAYIFFERHWDTVSRQLALGITGDIMTVMRFLQERSEPGLQGWIERTAQSEMRLEIVFEGGAVLPDEPPPRGDRIADRMLHEALGHRLSYPYHIETARPDERISVRIQQPDGVLTVLTPAKRMRSSTTYLFILWMTGTAVVVTGVAALFLRNQMRPIRRLVDAADALGKGRTVDDLKPSGATEIRRAASAFNQMQARIRRQIGQRTEMLAGVSHDLRTPLARMKLQLALLAGANPRSGGELAELESDVEQMEHMIDEYLVFASGQDGARPVLADLADLVADVAANARRKGGEVHLRTERPLVVAFRPNAIKRCITNLVENALRHGERVEIAVTRRHDAVAISVEDDGPGIPEDQREAVFKPFFRLDETRNPKTGGTGLGLAIARDIARSHGGDIHLGAAALGGLRAELRFPV